MSPCAPLVSCGNSRLIPRDPLLPERSEGNTSSSPSSSTADPLPECSPMCSTTDSPPPPNPGHSACPPGGAPEYCGGRLCQPWLLWLLLPLLPRGSTPGALSARERLFFWLEGLLPANKPPRLRLRLRGSLIGSNICCSSGGSGIGNGGGRCSRSRWHACSFSAKARLVGCSLKEM